MEFDYLKKILFKWLLGKEAEKEQAHLDEWLLKSEANKQLLDRLSSVSFLQEAIGDYNKELQEREWKKLKALTIERNKRTIDSRPLKTIFQREVCKSEVHADFSYKPQKNSHSSFEVICGRS